MIVQRVAPYKVPKKAHVQYRVEAKEFAEGEQDTLALAQFLKWADDSNSEFVVLIVDKGDFGYSSAGEVSAALNRPEDEEDER